MCLVWSSSSKTKHCQLLVTNNNKSYERSITFQNNAKYTVSPFKTTPSIMYSSISPFYNAMITLYVHHRTENRHFRYSLLRLHILVSFKNNGWVKLVTQQVKILFIFSTLGLRCLHFDYFRYLYCAPNLIAYNSFTCCHSGSF